MTDLGSFKGKNCPAEELNDTRAYGWKAFSVYLAANAVLCFGWFGWELVK